MAGLASRAIAKLRHISACRLCESLTHNIVLSGPFGGMKYQRSHLVSYCPKVLGTYELELAPIIEKLCSEPFELIVNVGAAEGYYAVGFARRNVQARIIAFEADEKVKQILIGMAQLNEATDRIVVMGYCDADHLGDVLSSPGQRLVFMDVEGAEDTLLDPGKIPCLSEVYILVEMHDFVSRDLAPAIQTRFEQSHQITEIWSRPRTLDDFPNVPLSRQRFLRLECLLEASMHEGRPGPMRWLYLEPSTPVARSIRGR